MKLDTMLLANYAEDQGGLLYIMGGGWDTITAQAPLEEAPENLLTVIRGYLVIRLQFHPTETNREHTFALTITDEDGQQIAELEGGMRVDRLRGIPATWDQNVNLVFPLTGIGLPREGNYRINLQVDGQFVGDKPFRVIKAFT